MFSVCRRRGRGRGHAGCCCRRPATPAAKLPAQRACRGAPPPLGTAPPRPQQHHHNHHQCPSEGSAAGGHTQRAPASGGLCVQVVYGRSRGRCPRGLLIRHHERVRVERVGAVGGDCLCPSARSPPPHRRDAGRSPCAARLVEQAVRFR